MTGPAVPSDEELRGLLERALVMVRAKGWTWETGALDSGGVADTLLPVVRRWADQRAAEELRAAARDVSWPTVNATFFRRVLRGRADALTREATT